MAVQASAEIIRQMESNIRKTVKNLHTISETIAGVRKASSTWNDAQAADFQSVMSRIARLTEQPIDELEQAVPKMEELARALDEYSQVRF